MPGWFYHPNLYPLHDFTTKNTVVFVDEKVAKNVDYMKELTQLNKAD